MTLYILRSEGTGRFYVGASEDPAIRLLQHNSILPNPSRWTRGRGPWRIVYTCEFDSKTRALQAEKFVKRMKSRAFIDKLIRGAIDLHSILENRLPRD